MAFIALLITQRICFRPKELNLAIEISLIFTRRTSGMHCSEAVFAILGIYLLAVLKFSFFAVCDCVLFLLRGR